MQAIQKFSDFQNKKAEVNQALKEADLQKEYGEVFVSLLKKYGVSSPAELDDAKKKEFFDEIGDYYKKGEGQTDKGEDLVDKEGSASVEEEGSKGEEWKEDEEEIDSIASNEEKEKEKEEDEEEDGGSNGSAGSAGSNGSAGTAGEEKEEEKEEVEEDKAEDIEKEKVETGEPEKAEGDVETQPEEVAPAEEAPEDAEAGKEAEPASDEDTAKDIEADKVETGKPQKVVMDFDSFVKANFEPKED